jgi:hypothetical protein
MDELLTKNEAVADEPYWAAIRKYLPATGCRADEVISISRASSFFEIEAHETHSNIWFRNSDRIVIFRLEKDTGNIGHAYVSSTHLPSF